MFRAIADATRRAIIDHLRSAPMAVQQLAANFRMSRPAVSKHLRILRAARLVSSRKHGRQRFYVLTPAPLLKCVQWLGGYDMDPTGK